jgi:hypothetical protein
MVDVHCKWVGVVGLGLVGVMYGTNQQVFDRVCELFQKDGGCLNVIRIRTRVNSLVFSPNGERM